MSPEDRAKVDAVTERLTGDKKAAQLYIERLAETLGEESSELESRATEYLETGQYWTGGSEFEGVYISDEYWVHHKTLHPEDDVSKGGSFLSCSC